MQPLNLDNISLVTYIIVFFAGVLTSFTPCIYPLLPVIVGFLGTKDTAFGARFVSACAYVLGLSLVYASLGVIAALTGSVFGSLTNNAFVYLFFGIFIIALGGSMLGLYEIPLPGFVSRTGDENKKSIFVGPLVLGMTSGLVASPCTAPVFGSILAYVAAKRAVVSGALLMFFYALGMSMLLLALGLSTGLTRLLPRSGNWMLLIKRLLAAVIILTGIYFLFSAARLAAIIAW